MHALRLAALAVLAMTLAACSTYTQDQISAEFAPIYPTDAEPDLGFLPSGAIYSNRAPGLFAADRRAARVGDILTVDFTENFAARDVQNTSTGRSDSFALDLPNVITNRFDIVDADLAAGTQSGFSGQGSTQQQNSLSGRLSVTVTRVLPGGNLEVMGQRRLSMTSGNEYVRLRGTVRPSDISSENIVRSDRLANADIQYIGAGDVSDASRQGWLRRAINGATPF